MPADIRQVILTVFMLAIGGLACGCSIVSYNSQAKSFYRDYRAGRTKSAAEKVSRKAEKRANSIDRLLWRLEEGAVLLAAGDFEASLRAFEKAEEILDDYDERASFNLRGAGSEGAALLSNTTAIPYYGRTYDKIMVNTYKAMAYARQGKHSAARVEMRRAYDRQKEAVERYGKTIDRETKRAKGNKVSHKDPRVQKEISKHYSHLDRLDSYAVYVNPFTTYLDALLHLSSTGNSDLERAKKSFERVLAMVHAKDLLADDVASVETRFQKGRIQPTVYVIVENGVAPIRREISFYLPVIVPRKGGGAYGQFAAASFPTLDRQRSGYGHIGLRNGNKSLGKTTLLASMDAIIAREFRHELPITIIRTISATAARGVMRHAARKEHGAGGDVAMMFYDLIVARADLRTWLSLPKEFQFTRLARPANGKLSLLDEHGQTITTLDLPEAEMTLVYLKTPSRDSVAAQVIKLR